ncbi:MAG: CD0415/CD1112 family protein [Ruminococcus sp.]|nr:CD0415/CD1112 family protein [Ruminococcus sp.]
MGIISDAIDALEDWCKDLFKDGITSQFDGISDLLSDTFSQTTGTGGSGGLVNDFVTQHPSQFTGGGTGGTTIWTTIETLCNNVVVPIGGFILTVILLNELIQMVLRGNNFKDFDDSIFIKWIIKALCGVILVANTYYIASALFSFGTTVCSNGLATLFGSGDYLSETLSINRTALSGLSLGELMTVWFISLIVHLGVLILIVAIVITLASRIIEVFMYLSIAPIPMAKVTSAETIARVLSGKNEDAPTDTKETESEEAPKKSNNKKRRKTHLRTSHRPQPCNYIIYCDKTEDEIERIKKERFW